jgi:hypothetical protein
MATVAIVIIPCAVFTGIGVLVYTMPQAICVIIWLHNHRLFL